MERNIRRYALFQGCRSLSYFWLPVFFLYLASVLEVGELLLLEAIYYLAVVLLEVPSGYFSDRIGRRLTLLIAFAANAAGCLLFATTGSFETFLVAELLLAVGMSFNSGTDSSLLYDSLAALGRGDEVGDIEARAHSWGYLALGLAALIGGALAGLDLRVAYVLSAAGALSCLAVVLSFEEPPRPSGEEAQAPLRQTFSVLGRLRDPALRWVFVFAVGMFVLNHVPYEFLQPYLGLLFSRYDLGGYAVTPPITGAAILVMMIVSAWASRRAMVFQRRLGVVGALLGVLVLQATVIGSMGAVVHAGVLSVVIFRSVPSAVMRPVTNAVIHPRLPSGVRATYLSLQSLAGRLLFSGSLALAGWVAGAATPISAPVLSSILLAYAAGAVGLFVLLILGVPAFRRALAAELHSPEPGRSP